MTAPFKCPACDGYGKRERVPGGKRKKCKACMGSCIVWSSDGALPYTYIYTPGMPYQWPWYWDNVSGTIGTADCGATAAHATDSVLMTDTAGTSVHVDDTTWTVS